LLLRWVADHPLEPDVELIAQTLIVAVVVIASTLFAAWRLMPAKTKLRLLDALNPTPSNALGRRLISMRKGLVTQMAHGCSACSASPTHLKRH
jgi:hypothetical protein